MRRVLLPLLLISCSDYSLSTKPVATAPVDSGIADPGPPPEMEVTPAHHSFGLVDVGERPQVPVVIHNVGEVDLVVQDVAYTSAGTELVMGDVLAAHGAFPWVLAPDEQRELVVRYVPADDAADEGRVWVEADGVDPGVAIQQGQGKTFDFSSGWYVLDDGVAYETSSDPARSITSHGDDDLYWYEPSGQHGLTDSTDPEADFALMREYVLDRAGPPVVPTGPFHHDGPSTLATFQFATYTYFLCDFYVDPADDPSLYTVGVGAADDGVQVMLNGEILGRKRLGDPAVSYAVGPAIRAGELNTLIVVLVDDSASHKYVHDLAFYRDGVLVTF